MFKNLGPFLKWGLKPRLFYICCWAGPKRDVREDGGSGLIFFWRGRIDHKTTKTKGERGIEDFLGEEAKRRERGFFSKGLVEEEDSCYLRER